jgi:hypothetical protein
MPRFIVYTEISARGPEKNRVVFLNADRVAKAVWHEPSETLKLEVQMFKKGSSQEVNQIELKGSEAREAVEVLRQM